MKTRKLHINIISKENKKDDLEYWLAKTPNERFAAAELLREQFYVINGFARLPRIQKVITIRKLNGNPS